MTKYLKLKKSNCKNCYKCIRHCPVKSIRFSGNQAHIVEDECILCGQCFVACPQNAKEIRNDVDAAKGLIASGRPVHVSLAPSFVANYEGATIASMTEALQKLGFAGVEETAVGATDVKNRYDEMVAQGERRVMISSCCHSVNLLIQKHYPDALPYLAPVVTPMQAHAISLKERYPGAKVVFIGPCISKKSEAEEFAKDVDCVLTFEELTGWFANEEIVLEKREDARPGGKTRFFPTAGGILKSMKCDSPDYTYLTIDGVENCIHAIQDVIAGNLDNCFIEMSACVGSCVGGPAMEKNRRAPVRDYIAVASYAGADDFPVEAPVAARSEKTFSYLGLHRQMPGSSAIQEILTRMGKTKPEDELNCGTCGYNTCREKAVAVLQGKADLTMCLPFLKEKAESFSDTVIQNTPNAIVVLNEELEIQQMNRAACDLMNIGAGMSIVGDQVVRVLDPLPFFEVLQSGRDVHDKRIYLAEYDRYVEQSIIYDKSYHILMCLMRDVTEEEKNRVRREDISRKAIETTDKVVEKQMRVVQEIASLLGETTAETKIALSKLKESLTND